MLLCLAVLPGSSPAQSAQPIEDYAGYEPQTKCSPTAKPGTTYLATWIVKRHGGTAGGISRPCRSGGASEHKEGRAFDWMLDADDPADRERAERLLTRLFATDKQGNPHALARRMGIMYLIWDDTMYAAYDGFAAKPYKHSGCRTVTRCSQTLRHRDHVHISLTRAGGNGTTSWYVRRAAAEQRRSARAAERRAAAREARREARVRASRTRIQDAEQMAEHTWGFAG
ncbi:hypothetical protein GCM10023226_20780 [Nocardioides nanhaiensis]|uniref:ARB-07466-like C-terminal domain-containing protein n=1 Tax=Nocardioides nanhaiensis TaxID=1476871 RepID=A0ABP8WAS3_9ACTN